MKKIISIILIFLMIIICVPAKKTFADDSGKVIIWENDSSVEKIASWNDSYRFALASRKSNEVYRYGETASGDIPDEIMEWMRKVTFYVDIEAESGLSVIVMTGWWDYSTLTGESPGLGVGENLIDNGNGTYTLAVNLENDNINTTDINIIERDLKIMSTTVDYKLVNIYFRDYQISEGKDIVVDISKGETASFVSAVSIASFYKGVAINGDMIEDSNYEKDDSTNTITLKADYLNSLPDGDYIFSIVFDDGHADAAFTITGHSNPSPVPTPEPVHVILNTGVN